MGYSIDPISADCYEGTTCLINKFGIKDEKMAGNVKSLFAKILDPKYAEERGIRPEIYDWFSANGIVDYLRNLFKESIS